VKVVNDTDSLSTRSMDDRNEEPSGRNEEPSGRNEEPIEGSADDYLPSRITEKEDLTNRHYGTLLMNACSNLNGEYPSPIIEKGQQT